MKKRLNTVTVLEITVAVLFIFTLCSCGGRKQPDEEYDDLFEAIPEREISADSAATEDKDASVVDEHREKADPEADNGDGSSDYNEADDMQFESEENEAGDIPSEPLRPRTIRELEVGEAIVIDDIEEDIKKQAAGKEIDYDLISDDIELPAFYSSDQSDNRDYVTPVRNQGYTALCWNFAAMGAVESDLLRNHDDLLAGTLNLSEKHGAYYNMHQAKGSVGGGIDDDYREFVFSEDDGFLKDYDTSYLSVGGVTDYCISILTAWKGPVLDDGKDSFHVLKGQSDIYTQNADVPSDPYKDPVCHVQNVYEIPATEKNRELIKRMIVSHGSVTASICSDDSLWTGKKVALYDYKQYGGDNTADHEILIVGWNDEYPAENFITRPPEDGAFICKNSWGTKNGASGYFYLSYYDNVLCNNNVVSYGCAMEGDNGWYDKNYQFAGFITHIMDPMIDKNNLVYMYGKNEARYGIVFSPEEDEELSAVGYFSMSTCVDDKVIIYELGAEADNISGTENDDELKSETASTSDEDNEDSLKADEFCEIRYPSDPIIEFRCKSLTGGYHTFPLDEALEIKKGKNYLICIEPGRQQKLIYEKAMDYTTKAHKDEWQHNLGEIHTVYTASGHSYLEDMDGLGMIRQDDKDFFIKAYTNKKNPH